MLVKHSSQETILFENLNIENSFLDLFQVKYYAFVYNA